VSEYDKPLPPVDDPVQAPFWAAAREGRFALQQCDTCQAFRWPPSPVCPECLHEPHHWNDAPPTGTVWSVAVYDHAYRREYRPDLPYDVVLVELDAGPRMITNVVGTPIDELVVGQRVTAVYDAVTPEVTLVRFTVTDEQPRTPQPPTLPQQPDPTDGAAR
jgi:uncharacterized OB-fold protein